MEKDLPLPAHLADLRGGLEDTDLIVREHRGDENGLGVDGLFEKIKIHKTILLHGEVVNLFDVKVNRGKKKKKLGLIDRGW